MTDKEIVIALQKCNNGKGHRCSECPALGKYNHRICKATIDKLAVNLIERLQSENTRLKAERDKAVEDMKSIVDNVREEHSDETCCFACKFDCDTSITDSGIHACECPGFERDDCFEWRGLEESE